MSCCPRKCRRFTVLGLAFVLAGSLGAYVFLKSRDAQARPPLGRSWPADLRVSVDRIDHSRFDTLLKTYVDGDGYVDYQAWKASAGDRRELQRYLADLGRADLKRRATRSARLAFWINAYNAVTIEGILQVYPTDSIRNHTSPLIGYNIWKHLPLRVADQTVSLNDIEHKILRKMREPRIHFAVVCASVGCPKLRNEAFTAEELESQLADNAVDFFSRSKHLRVDLRNRTLYLSDILKWFGSDFGRNDAELLAAIRPYLPKPAQRMVAAGAVRVKFNGHYDWSLNDQRTKPRNDRAGR